MKGNQKQRWDTFLRICLFTALIFLPVIGTPQKASAAPLIVTNLSDSGAGSLRQAISDALPGDTVIFAAGLQGEIALTTGQIILDKDLAIIGPALPAFLKFQPQPRSLSAA
jgi:hypothetical protein